MSGTSPDSAEYPVIGYGLLGPIPPTSSIPTPIRFWMGAVTDTGFRVNFDVSSSPASVGVIVSKSPSLQNPAYEGVSTSALVTSGRTGTYYTAAFTASGLDQDTLYYGAPVVNDIVYRSLLFTVRTAPAALVPTTFNFITSSCINAAYTLPNVWATIPPHNPAFMLFTGDIAYPDVNANNIGWQRDTNTRAFRNMANVQAMNLRVPFVYMFDDHDSAGNDGDWDSLYPSNATFDQIVTNSRTAIQETTPHYPLWNGGSKVIGQSWDWGRCRFLLPDLRSQRRWQVGTPTILGNGTNPPGSWDQLTYVLNAIAGAEADGIKVLFFVSSSTWVPAIFDSWQTRYTLEQGLVADAIRDAGVQVWLIFGDDHQCVIDDGVYSDRTSDAAGRFPIVGASALYQGGVFNQNPDTMWNGVTGNVSGPTPSSIPPGTGNATAYAKFEITDNGGDDVHVAVRFYGAPISGTSATSIGAQAVYRDDDADIEVQLTATSTLPVADGVSATIPVEKSWFGPVGGCSVDYAWTSGATGTVPFGPNQSVVNIVRPFTDGTDDTLTISNPVSCLLGSNTSRDITYFTPAAETVAYIAAMDVAPNSAIYYALDVLIAGLIADGVWAKTEKMWWLGAHDQQASLLNMITPADALPTIHNSPSWIAFQGWRGNSSSGAIDTAAYLDTGYAIPSGMQDSISMFVWTLEPALGFGDMGGAKYYISSSRSTTTDIRIRSSSYTTNSITSPTGEAVAGFIGFSRTGSANYKSFYNSGTALSTVTQVSSAPTSTTMWLAGFQDDVSSTTQQSSSHRNALAVIADGLSDAEVGYLYARWNTFLQAVGTI